MVNCQLLCSNNRVVIITLIFSIGLFIVPLELIDALTYNIWVEDHGEGGSSWCEGSVTNNSSKFIREPVNARSDYAYIILGCWMIVLAYFDFRDLSNQSHLTPSSVSETIIGTAGQQNDDDMFVQTDDDGEEVGPDEEIAMDRSQYLTQEGEVEEKEIEENQIPNGLLQYPHITLFNGIFNILHGLGSFWNHACQCRPGGKADVAGMLAVVTFYLFYFPLQILMETKNPSVFLKRFFSIVPVIGQTIILLVPYMKKRVNSTKYMTVFLCIYIVIICSHIAYLFFIRRILAARNKNDNSPPPHRISIKVRFILFTFVSFALGYLCWSYDSKLIWCFMENSSFRWLQGHALWHFLTCISPFRHTLQVKSLTF